MVSEEIDFDFFSTNLAFRLPWRPIKFSGLDKIHMLDRELLKENFYKTFVKKFVKKKPLLLSFFLSLSLFFFFFFF